MKVFKYIASAAVIAAMSGGVAMAAQYDCKDHYNVLKKQAAKDGFVPTKCLLYGTGGGGKSICQKWEYPWSVDPEVAYEELALGNGRFVAGTPLRDDQNAACVNEVATNGQHPYAVIVACSDSRVTPEIVTDKGLGDVFIVRAAGHVVDNPAIGSIEYALEHLGARLIVVVGHQKCGAVKATIDQGGTPLPTDGLHSLQTAIQPAVDRACTPATTGTCLDAAVHENVTETIARIKSMSPDIITPALSTGEVKIVGGYYGLDGKLVLEPLLP